MEIERGGRRVSGKSPRVGEDEWLSEMIEERERRG
jgi:hypothetical protein